MRIVSFFFLSILSFSTFSKDIVEVKVWNNDFEVIHIVSDAKELEEFSKLWESRTEIVFRAEPNWTHKIDINPGDRWLYHENGYLQVLSKQATPYYKIKNYNEFNKLLKTHNKAQQNDLR